MSENVSYIDYDAALKRIGGNVALYKKLLSSFLNDIKIEKLYEAIESGNGTDTTAAAHAIKGVSANLALTGLQRITTAIDIDAKAGLDCNSYMPELKKIVDKTVELVSEYIQIP